MASLTIEAETLDILLIEDDENDVQFLKRALRSRDIKNRIRSVADGEEALDYIFHRGQYSDVNLYPMPGLVLLDLNIPKLDGVDILRIVKKDSRLKTIPIIVLSTSSQKEDIRNCYKVGVNSYVVKPTDFGEFKRVIGDLANYWLSMNRLPDIFRKQLEN